MVNLRPSTVCGPVELWIPTRARREQRLRKGLDCTVSSLAATTCNKHQQARMQASGRSGFVVNRPRAAKLHSFADTDPTDSSVSQKDFHAFQASRKHGFMFTCTGLLRIIPNPEPESLNSKPCTPNTDELPMMFVAITFKSSDSAFPA